MNKEIRIDVTTQTEEELALANEQAQLIFRFNNTMPGTAEYADLMHKIFPTMGENSRVGTPLTAVRPHMVKIGKNVVVMPGCLMMSAGGITIDDGAMIAANVQLISNNHDLYKRQVITCKPVHIGKNAWIGAGATILPGDPSKDKVGCEFPLTRLFYRYTPLRDTSEILADLMALEADTTSALQSLISETR